MTVTVDEMEVPRHTLMWIAGAFLSLFLFAAIIALSYTLGAREGGYGDPPLVRATQGPYKIVPGNSGGQKFPHQKIGVYNRVSGEQTVVVERLLPPAEQPQDLRTATPPTPRVIDPQPEESESNFVPPADNTPDSLDGAITQNMILPESGTPAPDSGAVERNLPESEIVSADTIAGLIRQNPGSETSTDPDLPVASQVSTPEAPQPSSDTTEVVMAAGLPEGEPVNLRSSRIEPVVVEEIMSDPARVLDGKQVPIPPARPPATASSQPSATPEPANGITGDTLASSLAPAAKPPQTPELAPAELAKGEQIATLDIISPRPKPVYEPEPSMVMPDSTPKNLPEDSPGEVVYPAPEDAPKEAVKDAPKEVAKNAPKEVAKAMPAGSFVVQIASFRKKEEAESAWRRAAKTHKDLVAGLRPSIQRADLGSRGIFYRLRIGPLENKAQAQSLCKLLKKRKQACLVPKQ